MKNKEELIKKIPFIAIVVFTVISTWLTIRAVFNYLFLMVGQFLNEIPTFILFGNPLKPSIIGMVSITVISIGTWLVSTKVTYFQTKMWRIAIFFNMFIGICLYYTWYITAPVYNTVVPYLQKRVSELEVVNVWHEVLLGNTENLMILLVFIPTIVIVLLLIWLFGQYSHHTESMNESFLEFEFKNKYLQRFFKSQNDEHWPDVVLGPDSKTQELIIQPGRDRTLNNIIIGSIGTGKTAALVLPILNNDLHWMVKFINDFPSIYNREDFHTENVKGMYLNGISVIEPSNDLCQKAFQLVKAHKIPEKSVFYIDPTNPNTPSINPMQGPVDQVAEALAMVIEGLAEGGDSNVFFAQSERNHLKHYVYLLKLHDPKQEVTFDMLLDMYNNSQLVRRMHVKLKGTFPENIDSIENRDERNHWKIVQQIDEWFDMNLLPKKGKNGSEEKVTHGEFRGDTAYYDAKAEYVQGLRNILNDIGANKLIRRVLFGKSDFSFDAHLEYGGVLLVNTAKGEMAGLSNVLGKLVLLSLQNAVFRRQPNISNFHHILTDEFPDFIYKPFKEFPAQSRKYKVIVTVVAQTVAQLADKYGETYMHTLLGTLRHKMVYGDIPDYDAQLFSKIFGEEERFEETQSEQSVSPLQEQPVTRAGSSYAKTKEAILSPSDIIYQKPFQAAVKLVANNKPMPVRQIDANFVPKEEFINAVVEVEGNSGEFWLEKRNEFIKRTTQGLVESSIEEVMDESMELIDPNDEKKSTEDEEITNSIDLEPHIEQPIHYQYQTEQEKSTIIVEVEKPIEIEAIEVSSNEPTPEENEMISPELEKQEEVETPKPEVVPVIEQKEEKINLTEKNSDDPLDEIFGEKSIEPTKEKSKVSELGEEQLSLLKDIQNEADKVPAPKQEEKLTKDSLAFLMEEYKE
ncbi:type IV secretory system conjugative DNA transfer family protein [Bacillus sp. AFS040349]|uniref:type IV secretory system conjugative DNA transfer family protein n=1 Tax=Bacillus sp. AFS040349 TaxID=2033502 RepID=UPI000BFE8122|nr:type IV secretory system conjugative DNA transfer family protein [Bacillus sp. AFS040349]PGT82216.1 conjugal transfer protein TraG [Bacillus sp. AFS040349]